MVNSVHPGSLFTAILPPWARTIASTMARPETGAARGVGAGCVGAHEPVEDVAEDGGRDARAGVTDS